MKLDNDNYYSIQADKEFMSYSQFKDFDKCPAMAMAKLNKEYIMEETDSMLIGSFVDSWLDGELDKFIGDHPQVFNTRTGELKAQFRQAEQLCEVIKKDDYLYEQLKGQRQVIITGNIAGVKFKGKIDSLLPDKIVDGKVLKDCEDIWQNGEKKPFYKANGYDIQAAIYTTIYGQQFGEKLPFELAVITKETTPDKRVFIFSRETIDNALQEIIAKAPVYDAIKKGIEPAWNCGKCSYCKSQKLLNKESIEIL